MHFGSLENLVWWSGLTLEVLVCLLALYRGLYRRLPLFTIYLALLLTAEASGWLTYHTLGRHSPAAFRIYWISQATLLLARGAAVAEICRRVLRPYPGIWKLCRGFLVAIGAFLVVAAAIAAHRSGTYIAPIVLTGDRGLELAVVGILLFALVFCRYYRVGVEPFVALIAFGLGVYSAVQVANNTILNQWLGTYFHWWSHVRLMSFEAAVLIWFLALLKPLPERQRAPALLSKETYQELQPQLNFRLRQLNARLSEMLK